MREAAHVLEEWTISPAHARDPQVAVDGARPRSVPANSRIGQIYSAKPACALTHRATTSRLRRWLAAHHSTTLLEEVDGVSTRLAPLHSCYGRRWQCGWNLVRLRPATGTRPLRRRRAAPTARHVAVRVVPACAATHLSTVATSFALTITVSGRLLHIYNTIKNLIIKSTHNPFFLFIYM